MKVKKKYNRILFILLLLVFICVNTGGCKKKETNQNKDKVNDSQKEIMIDNNAETDEQDVSSKKENQTPSNNKNEVDQKEDTLSDSKDSASGLDFSDIVEPKEPTSNTEPKEPSDSTQSKESSKLEDSKESTNEAWGPIHIY